MHRHEEGLCETSPKIYGKTKWKKYCEEHYADTYHNRKRGDCGFSEWVLSDEAGDTVAKTLRSTWGRKWGSLGEDVMLKIESYMYDSTARCASPYHRMIYDCDYDAVSFYHQMSPSLRYRTKQHPYETYFVMQCTHPFMFVKVVRACSAFTEHHYAEFLKTYAHHGFVEMVRHLLLYYPRKFSQKTLLGALTLAKEKLCFIVEFSARVEHHNCVLLVRKYLQIHYKSKTDHCEWLSLVYQFLSDATIKRDLLPFGRRRAPNKQEKREAGVISEMTAEYTKLGGRIVTQPNFTRTMLGCLHEIYQD